MLATNWAPVGWILVAFGGVVTLVALFFLALGVWGTVKEEDGSAPMSVFFLIVAFFASLVGAVGLVVTGVFE